jgi:hypothetical protein
MAPGCSSAATTPHKEISKRMIKLSEEFGTFRLLQTL